MQVDEFFLSDVKIIVYVIKKRYVCWILTALSDYTANREFYPNSRSGYFGGGSVFNMDRIGYHTCLILLVTHNMGIPVSATDECCCGPLCPHFFSLLLCIFFLYFLFLFVLVPVIM